ncbi:MAG TPA: hypothetical protein VKT99_04905 [Xanthobacteraceae bacterium]|nr:hypothetical protein [Xanthobacteraceae bacterium]
MKAKTVEMTGLLLLWALALLLLANKLEAAPLTFVTALPISQDLFTIRQYAQPGHSTGGPAGLNGNLWNLNFPTVLIWGPIPRVAIFGSIDPEYSLINETLSGKRQTRTASGFGDSLLFARYTLYHRDSLDETFQIDPLVGLFLPTGYYNKSDHLGRLPLPMQNGSGSVDTYLGYAAIHKTLTWEIDWDSTYQYDPPASSGFQHGSSAHADIAIFRRLTPWVMPDQGVPRELWGGLETNFIWQDRSQIGGRTDGSTGGIVWYLDPSFYYASRFWSTGAAIQIPVVQHLFGHGQLSSRYNLFIYFEYYLIAPSIFDRS